MNEKLHEPVYRAAADMAHAELRQISERMAQLRVRQETIFAAVQALKLVLDAPVPVSMINRQAQKPVYEMNGPAEQIAQEPVRVQALA